MNWLVKRYVDRFLLFVSWRRIPKSIYNSIRGQIIKISRKYFGYTTNDLIWKGVNILKEAGYIIDSVQLSGFGTETNPYTYHIIMSRAINSTYTAE